MKCLDLSHTMFLCKILENLTEIHIEVTIGQAADFAHSLWLSSKYFPLAFLHTTWHEDMRSALSNWFSWRHSDDISWKQTLDTHWLSTTLARGAGRLVQGLNWNQPKREIYIFQVKTVTNHPDQRWNIRGEPKVTLQRSSYAVVILWHQGWWKYEGDKHVFCHLAHLNFSLWLSGILLFHPLLFCICYKIFSKRDIWWRCHRT